MDITLERTFLEIVGSGSFLRASERLHVTQTAVSARVKALEDMLGRQLFIRNKSGASLTPAGQQFVRHAAALVQAWERARQQVALPPGHTSMVTIGCEASLWDPLMLNWLLWMRERAVHLALRTEVGLSTDLLARVSSGTLDVAVMYAPQQRPGMQIDLLIEEKLVFVTSSPQGRKPKPDQYVHIDWGPEFSAQFALAYPELSGAAVSASLGPLGLGYVLAAGGAGYFRMAVLREHLEAGRLHQVRGAPSFSYPAYAVYSSSAEAEGLALALKGLKEVIGASPPSYATAKASSRKR
jgi:DNA-binding transcriptional LysR family regulator